MLTVDSTNRFVADITEPLTAGCAQLCVAELQNAGRGRRGRSWMAPFGSGICMSVGWQFAEAAADVFGAESCGRRCRRQLRCDSSARPTWGSNGRTICIWKGRKLGGILIEMRGESAGPAHVVIGIGINMRMPLSVRLLLAEQQAAVIADVYEILRERTPNRNILVGRSWTSSCRC